MNSKQIKEEKKKYLEYLKIMKLTQECLSFKEWLEERMD